MKLLHRILYAAHASGSHHKLALRALEQLKTADAEKWRRTFLAHASALLAGSKAPDKSFKDFQNHVLHPATSGGADWGGAPAAATLWYGRLTDLLEREQWSEAAYAAGVLSHYLSDPAMPLHTASSDAETKIHRAAEWSVSRDFEALWREGAATETRAAPVGSDWVARMVREAAHEAHELYEPLIASYDVGLGSRAPERGYDRAGRAIIARQLHRAAAMIATALDRAVEDAGVAPPELDLTARTALATLEIPVAWVIKKLDDAADRRAVARIYAEIARTGKLVENAPEECRAVRQAREDSLGAADASDRADAPPRRRRLERGSPVEDAPSIGPKTAARLAPLGVSTVADLLAADPKSVADALSDRRITPSTVAAWRDQAALLVRLPGLRRADSVLLVASGYRDVPSIAAADANRMREHLIAASKTESIQRALRSSATPDIAAIRRTISSARSVLAGAEAVA